jgi:hypothetical protein
MFFFTRSNPLRRPVPKTAPRRVACNSIPTFGVAMILGALAFANVAQAAVKADTHASARATKVNPLQLPSWVHSPLTAAQVRGEVAIPTDLNTVSGKLRLTTADYTTGVGGLAVDAHQAIGQTLIAGEALELPGNTLFSLSSHLPAAAAQRQLTQLKSAFSHVTGATCEGYTDYGLNTTRAAQVLGMRRALQVCHDLHSENPKIVVRAVSYGSARPAVVGGSINTHRSVNRRVVIDITRSSVSLPGAPTITMTTAGDGSIGLGVTPQASALPVARYQYSLDAGKTWVNLTTTGSGPVTGTIAGLTNGRTYAVIVRVIDAAGTSLNSQSVTATPTAMPVPNAPNAPAAPTSVTSTSTSTTVSLPPSSPPPTTTTVSSTTVPDAPTLTSASPGDGQATIVFAAPSSSSPDQPLSYEVSTDGGTTWAPATTSGSSPYTVTLTGLTNGDEYTVEVRAVDSAGDSSPSNSIAVTPAAPEVQTVPDAPQITSGSWAYDDNSGDYEVTLTWTEDSDGGSPVTEWDYSQDGGSYTALTGVTEVGGTYSATFDSGYNACDFNNGYGNHEYTIQATNTVGTSLPSSGDDVTFNGDC